MLGSVMQARSCCQSRSGILAGTTGNSNTRAAAPCLSRGLTAASARQQRLKWHLRPASEVPDAASGAPAKAAAGTSATASGEGKSDEYSTTMSAAMGTSLTYRHELGLNFNRITDDIIVGSCLQTAADVDRLAEQEGVTTIFSLQEDSDMAYFDLDLAPIQARCQERGDVRHVRFPVRDFDPFDLRKRLPKAVSRLALAHNPRFGTVYIHCTAGLGRAPATALAYMYWLRGYGLPEAHQLLTSIRRCSPRIEAIRAATADLLLGIGPTPVTIAISRYGSASVVQVAGLDVGWSTRLDLQLDPATQRFSITRDLMPGRYPYKFILDDRWTYSADHPTYKDGDNINNYVDVVPQTSDASVEARQQRLMSPGAQLLPEEREELSSILCPWATHTVIPEQLQAIPSGAEA